MYTNVNNSIDTSDTFEKIENVVFENFKIFLA